MSNNNGDMPASPSDDIPSGEPPYYKPIKSNGLTKREHFAAMAMQGIVSDFNYHAEMNNEVIAGTAVDLADELLKALDN